MGNMHYTIITRRWFSTKHNRIIWSQAGLNVWRKRLKILKIQYHGPHECSNNRTLLWSKNKLNERAQFIFNNDRVQLSVRNISRLWDYAKSGIVLLSLLLFINFRFCFGFCYSQYQQWIIKRHKLCIGDIWFFPKSMILISKILRFFKFPYHCDDIDGTFAS